MDTNKNLTRAIIGAANIVAKSVLMLALTNLIGNNTMAASYLQSEIREEMMGLYKIERKAVD